jgi:hypothetical protein
MGILTTGLARGLNTLLDTSCSGICSLFILCSMSIGVRIGLDEGLPATSISVQVWLLFEKLLQGEQS